MENLTELNILEQMYTKRKKEAQEKMKIAKKEATELFAEISKHPKRYSFFSMPIRDYSELQRIEGQLESEIKTYTNIIQHIKRLKENNLTKEMKEYLPK